MNNKEQQNIQSEKTLTEIFKYNAEAGASEYHVMIHSTKPEDTYEEQLNAVLNTYDNLLAKELKGGVAVFKRYFLSDAANQADMLLALTPKVPTAHFPLWSSHHWTGQRLPCGFICKPTYRRKYCTTAFSK